MEVFDVFKVCDDFEREGRKFPIKRLLATVVVVIGILVWCMSSFGAPHFVTPGMIQRNGLTDEQYELLWCQGKHPQITIDAARDWIFRASRYHNVTNWLEVIGRTNDFARLVIPLSATNEMLVVSNGVLNSGLVSMTRKWKSEKQRADYAEEDAESARAVWKAAKRTEKNVEKVIKELEKARKKAASEDEAALWSSIIALLKGEAPNYVR